MLAIVGPFAHHFTVTAVALIRPCFGTITYPVIYRRPSLMWRTLSAI